MSVTERTLLPLVKQIRGGRGPRKPVDVPATSLAIRESTGGVDDGDHDVVRGMEFIERQGGAGIQVKDITAVLSITRRSFERNSREQFDRSPGERIQRRRLAKANDLLAHTDFSIDRISEVLGFEEPTSFTKFFQKRAGSSPREFRRQRGMNTNEFRRPG